MTVSRMKYGFIKENKIKGFQIKIRGFRCYAYQTEINVVFC